MGHRVGQDGGRQGGEQKDRALFAIFPFVEIFSENIQRVDVKHIDQIARGHMPENLVDLGMDIAVSFRQNVPRKCSRYGDGDHDKKCSSLFIDASPHAEQTDGTHKKKYQCINPQPFFIEQVQDKSIENTSHKTVMENGWDVFQSQARMGSFPYYL